SGERDELVRELKSLAPFSRADSQRRLQSGFDADERDRLKVAAILSRTFQAQSLQLRSDVFGSEHAARRARSPPFELIVGEKLDVRAQRGFTDGAGCALSLLCERAERERNDKQGYD